MTGLGVLAWKLHGAQDEAAWLRTTAANLYTAAHASLEELRHTRLRLADATDDKRVLHRFLSAAGEAERELKDDLGHLRLTHEDALVNHEQSSQRWAARDTALQFSLASETSAKQQAEQLAAQFEERSRQLEGETAALHQCVSLLRAENGAMLRDLNLQASRIHSLETENASLRTCNSQLECTIRQQQSAISNLEAKILCLQSEYARLHSRR